MPEDVQPAELARLVEFAERPRASDWSLRAALTRYGQPQPQRASDVTVVLRRLDGALKAQLHAIAHHGGELWSALQDGAPVDAALVPVVDLLQVAVELDRLGDRLAAWAVDRAGERPDGEVDAVTTALAARLDALGVPREEGPPRPGGRRGRG
jgi:hypothetical protein